MKISKCVCGSYPMWAKANNITYGRYACPLCGATTRLFSNRRRSKAATEWNRIMLSQAFRKQQEAFAKKFKKQARLAFLKGTNWGL